MTSKVELPGPRDRLLIVGRTGSGKTVAGFYHLSLADFDAKPWVIIDTKRDEALLSVEGLRFIQPGENPPDKPGLYAFLGNVNDVAGIEQFLMEVFEHENIGLYIDEGYAVHMGKPYSPALRLIVTQGRSKNIPLIINSQRPVWLDKFVRSEAGYFQLFHLNSEQDRKTMGEFIPDDVFDVVNLRLDKYHSLYYDGKQNLAQVLGPVPAPDESKALIEERLVPLLDPVTEDIPVKRIIKI